MSIKTQIKNWPRHVEGEDIEITNMIADIVSVEISRAKRNIAEQLFGAKSAVRGVALGRLNADSAPTTGAPSTIPVSSQVDRGAGAPNAALWTKRVKATDVADMSPDVFVSSLIDVVRAGTFDLNTVCAEYSGLLCLMMERASRWQSDPVHPNSVPRLGERRPPDLKKRCR